MFRFNLKFRSALVCLYLVFSFSSAEAQNPTPATIDLKKSKIVIDSLDKEFSQYYFKGDSVALYNMYSKDARFETLKGNDILLSWGRQIRNSVKNDTRHLLFTTTSLSTDNEFLVELGIFEIKDSKGNSKQRGKYLIAWKQEDGKWKIYRDMGL